MQAIVLHGPNDLRFDPEYPDPTPAPGEVLLKLTYSSICQTDIEMWQHGMFSAGGTPRILGHEAAGIVAELGEGVTSLRVGDRVAVENVRTCGTCFFCRKGTSQLCENGRNFGFSDNGGLAEYGVWPAALCIKLPSNVTNEEAPLAEPTSVAVHAVMNSNVHIGDIAAVIGCGVVGLITLQVLQAAGARVIAIDPREQSLKIAKDLGASAVLNPNKVDVAELLPQITEGLRNGLDLSRALSPGLGETESQRRRSQPSEHPTNATNAEIRDPGAIARPVKNGGDSEPSDSVTSATRTPNGPDVIIETAGAPGTALNAAQWTRRGGKAVIVGFSHQSQENNFGRAHMGEKTVMGSSATGTGEYHKAVALIASGKVNVKPLISALVPLDRGIPDGFQRMLKPEKDVYRILVGNG
ncbi:MAG: alcohol dehydrogenase catalytic domain-containing protein [Chloroflexi bacterium]|nr:alcohol dehydrogenase catalytic domain-containing protein [Chloroflexota bacterium]